MLKIGRQRELLSDGYYFTVPSHNRRSGRRSHLLRYTLPTIEIRIRS